MTHPRKHLHFRDRFLTGRGIASFLVVMLSTLFLCGCVTGTQVSATDRVAEGVRPTVGVGQDDAEDTATEPDPEVPEIEKPEHEPQTDDPPKSAMLHEEIKPETSSSDPATIALVPGAVEPEAQPTREELLAAAAIRVDRDFSELDRAVRALPRASSITETVAQLDALATDDWERARAVYIWMTENIAYDAAAFFSGRRATTDPEGVFRTGTSVCQGYAELFRSLGTGLGLEVELVSGYSKGYSYRAGQSFSRTNHAWNAVRIDGAWHLLDSTWGAGYVDGRRFVREYGEFWFDPDPALFLRTHLPEDNRWQLVAEPVTMSTYVAMPFVESYVFENLYETGLSDDEIGIVADPAREQGIDSGDFQRLGELGVSTNTMVEAVTEGAGLPVAYRFEDYDIHIVQAPIRSSLPAGEPVTVVVRAPGLQDGAFINNNEFHFFERSGDTFTGTVRPVRGSLLVSLELRYNGREGYWGVLEYSVR